MVSKTKKLALQLFAFAVAVFVLLAYMSVFPASKTYAAGTDLYVGYSGRNNNFSTVQAAVDKAASLNPSSESTRVTIHIAPGTYRQQVIVQTPYITFVNDEPDKGDAVLTWYYGIGYKYYSANSKGYYDANLANSKSGKNVANYRWGATVQLWPKATNFKAKNIVFENSFNRYITQEELNDGVELTGDTSVTKITQVRNSWTDAKSKAATERAAALSVDTGYAEFLNCQFLSSQDTLYTGGSPQYYKNCLIEGQTDYIFGGSNAVFDSCELRWKGYSSGSVGGYITAAREQGSPYTGYLFKNCKVTANPELTVSAGYLGRPWGQTAQVLFVDTTLQNGNMITAAGWTSMSGVEPESVNGFKESGTKLSNGQRVDLSQRRGHTVSDSDAAKIDIKSYMNNWTPSYLNGDGGSSSSGSGQSSSNIEGAIKTCGGWFEEAFVEWDSSKLGSNVKVSYALAGTSDYKAVDAELIRGSRVDIPGLKGNTAYNISIQGSNGSAGCEVKTMAFDRSGYAHWNNSSGVGAYNNDGTLKSGVTVIYVTNSNKDTITYNGQTGLYNIFYNGKPKNVDFRLIGSIDVPSGAKANNGQQNDGSNMLYLQNGENVTIEGIGYDTSLNQWGFEMKRSASCEVRNLWLGKYPDDGVSMSGSSDHKSTNMWIHNNTIEKGYNAYAGNGIVDDDKADGDGSLDIKWSEYVTVSYNIFKDAHKTSLVGGATNHMQDWITYHHNWFNNTESRNPRARNAHVHSFNNYFYNNKQYGIGASYNSKVFSEANYYENTNLPLDAVNMGNDSYSGTIKSYGDKFVSCNMGNSLAYQIVNSRNDKAYVNNLQGGGDGYDNFDTDSSKIYSSYSVTSADAAKADVTAYAGRMQNKAYNSGTATSGGNDVPPIYEEYMKSTLIARLDVKDASYGAQWSIAESFSVGDKAFGDREHVIASVPSYISGGEHIITACNSKNTDADLAVLSAAKDITVYVALDQRVTTPPSWLSSFRKTGDVVEINDSEAVRAFDVYAADVNAGGSLTLGTNGMSGACMNYIVFVKEKAVVTTATTTTTTTTTTATTTQPAVQWKAGDANCDGSVDLSDAVIIMQSLANPNKYGLNGSDERHITEQGMANGDVEGGGNGVTSNDALAIQKYMLKLVDALPVA